MQSITSENFRVVIDSDIVIVYINVDDVENVFSLSMESYKATFVKSKHTALSHYVRTCTKCDRNVRKYCIRHSLLLDLTVTIDYYFDMLFNDILCSNLASISVNKLCNQRYLTRNINSEAQYVEYEHCNDVTYRASPVVKLLNPIITPVKKNNVRNVPGAPMKPKYDTTVNTFREKINFPLFEGEDIANRGIQCSGNDATHVRSLFKLDDEQSKSKSNSIYAKISGDDVIYAKDLGIVENCSFRKKNAQSLTTEHTGIGISSSNPSLYTNSHSSISSSVFPVDAILRKSKSPIKPSLGNKIHISDEDSESDHTPDRTPKRIPKRTPIEYSEEEESDCTPKLKSNSKRTPKLKSNSKRTPIIDYSEEESEEEEIVITKTTVVITTVAVNDGVEEENYIPSDNSNDMLNVHGGSYSDKE